MKPRCVVLLAIMMAAAALPACTLKENRMRLTPAGGASTRMLQSTEPAAASAATAPASMIPYAVERAVLDNGLKVLFVPMPADGLVSYWSVVRTGSRDEVESGVTGFAHFFEHMMFAGTETLPNDKYDAIVNGIGADANAFTTDDFTAYHLSFAAPDLPTVIEVEADRFQNLKYTEDKFKTEAGAVYGEYRKGRTEPFEVLWEALQNTAFDRHTYKHTTIGFEADIAAMPAKYEYSKGFFTRFYRPENVVLVVAGDFVPATALELIKKHYGGWRRGYQEPKIPVEPAQTAPRRAVVPFDGETLPILAVSFKGERFLPGDRQMMAGSLLGDLAFGETSDLYKKLVIDEQRVEFIFPDFDYKRDPGLWTVFVRVKDAADIDAIEGEIWNTIEKMQRSLVAPERLHSVRANAKYEFLGGLDTPAGVTGSLARFIALTGDIAAIDELYATLAAVTPEDVRSAARRYLVRESNTTIVLHGKGSPLPERKTDDRSFALLPVAEDPNVAFKLWFKVGSQDDPPGKEGLAALTAELLSDGGTAKLPYDAILQKLFPMAASYSARADKEMTVFTGVVTRDNVSGYYELLRDAILSPGFRTEDFDRIRENTISEIENELRFSSDEELGKATLHNAVFAGTPYGHITIGTVAALKSITLGDVKEFYARHYTRDNVVIGLGGAYSESLPALVAADFARLPARAPEAIATPAAASIGRRVEGRNVILVEKDGPSAAISFGYPIELHRGSREFYAMWIANSWLGEHRNSSSHLYQVIREARGMNYGDYSYIETFPDGGRLSMPPTGVGRRSQLFEVWIRPVKREQTLFALRAALREIDELSQNGLTPAQFAFTKRFLKNYSLHFAETTRDRLGYAIDDRFYGVDGHLAKFRKMMDEISIEEVNAAIKKHLQTKDLTIAIVASDAKALAEELAAGAPSVLSYAEGANKKPEQLQMDNEIGSYPLGIVRDRIRIVPVKEMFER